MLGKDLLGEEVGILWGVLEASTLTPVEFRKVRNMYSPAPSTLPNTSQAVSKYVWMDLIN